MKSALLLTPTILTLVVVALVVAEWGGSSHSSIYRNGVFLTDDTPDVPPYAVELLSHLRTLHSAAELEAALKAGTRVVVYDCSASSMIGDSFFSLHLMNGYSLIGINVVRNLLQSPGGCTRDPASAPFFSFEHALSSGKGNCYGAGGARFDEGHLFKAILERELRLNGGCAEPLGSTP